MDFHRHMVAMGFAILTCGCDIEQNPREASTFSFPGMSGTFTAAVPKAFSTESTSVGPRLCDTDACPTAADALGPVFESGSSLSLAGILSHLDGRMEVITGRAKDHFVPCLEEGARKVPTQLSEKLLIEPNFHCYLLFGNQADPRRSSDYEQLLFGDGKGPVIDAAVRFGDVDDLATTLWVRQNQTTGVTDFWLAASRSLANEGKSLLQVRTQGDTLELSIAGLNQFTGHNLLACGVQAKADGEHLYLSGRFFAPTTFGFALEPGACNALEKRTFCLSSVDLSAVDPGVCEGAGLTDFTLPEYVPEDLAVETWGSAVHLDYSKMVTRFTLEGLDVY